MPGTITIGHVLMLLGTLAALYALAQLFTWARYRGPQHGRGTPGYARVRDARRYAIWSIAAGALLFIAGCLTPLCTIAIIGA